jgi:membrane protein YdbS with pleckstrin-like domain
MAANANLRVITSHLRRLTLFARLTPEQLERVAAICQLVQTQPGMVLAYQGQPAQALFMFVAGRGELVRQHNGAFESAGSVNEGQYVGEEALYTERIEPCTLRVVEAGIVLVVPKHALAGIIVQSPEMRANIGMQPTEIRRAVRIFKGQREDETVLHIFKRHWWSYVTQLWLPLLIATGCIIGAVLLISTPALALLLLGAAIIVPGGLALLLYADWQDDKLVITDQRIVKIYDQFWAFEKTINEIPFERAHEVNAEIPPDPFARLFGYGTVVIKTAGGAGTITVETLPNPDAVRRAIFNQQDVYRHDAQQRSKQTLEREIEAAIGIPSATLQTPAPALRGKRDDEPPEMHSPNPFATRYVSEDGRTIIYRHHISIWLRIIALPALLMLGALAFGAISLFLPALRGVEAVAIIVAGAVFLFGAAWFYLADWDWRHDTLTVEEDSITITRKRPLWLQNEVEQIRLSQVDNVFTEVSGFVNSILQRGDIRISLIGSDVANAKFFRNVGDPQGVAGIISERLAAIHAQSAKDDDSRQRRQIAEYLAAYHERVIAQGLAPYAPQYQYPSQGYPPQPPQQQYGQGQPPPPPDDLPPPIVRDGSRPPNIPRMRGE